MNDDYRSRLFCDIGDTVVVTSRAEFCDDESDTGRSFAEAGTIYKVVGLVEWGWDLIRESGTGPKQIRVLNSTMPSIMKVVSAGPAGACQ